MYVYMTAGVLVYMTAGVLVYSLEPQVTDGLLDRRYGADIACCLRRRLRMLKSFKGSFVLVKVT